jgi:hypothetical protein
MPAGYGGVPGGGKETRLGDQDTARRRGGVTEGLGASRESSRNRNQDRADLGPVRRGRPGQRGGQNRPAGGGAGTRPGAPRTRGGGRPRPQGDRVEKPRTDENAVSAEGREQPVIEPTVETTPAPVADAPKSTTRKKKTEDPTKLEKSGDEGKS